MHNRKYFCNDCIFSNIRIFSKKLCRECFLEGRVCYCKTKINWVMIIQALDLIECIKRNTSFIISNEMLLNIIFEILDEKNVNVKKENIFCNDFDLPEKKNSVVVIF